MVVATGKSILNGIAIGKITRLPFMISTWV